MSYCRSCDGSGLVYELEPRDEFGNRHDTEWPCPDCDGLGVMVSRWDDRHLALAEHIAGASKDPSTRTGCVIVRPDNTIASTGYNGFPRGVSDSRDRLEDRSVKYALTVHAELNAILTARERLDGYSAYVFPFQPCSRCAAALIQAGVARVVAPLASAEQRERWGVSFDLAARAFVEAGVELTLVPWCEERAA